MSVIKIFYIHFFFTNRDGRLQVGDELLQVNGESLEGSTGETVAKLLRAETHIIQLVIARQVSVKEHWESGRLNKIKAGANFEIFSAFRI